MDTQNKGDNRGSEAIAFTRAFLGGGPVELRFDGERLDRHGRFLAYVYVNGQMLNEELVRAGLARAELGYNSSDALKRRYRAAQREAQSARRGLWTLAARPDVDEESLHDPAENDSP